MVKGVLESRDEIAAKIIEQRGITEQELEAKVREKQEEYGGLLTDAGAAYSIAKEMGVELGFEPKGEELSVNELKDGLEAVDIEGEVTRIFPTREWESKGRKGKVASFIIKDKTGEVRLTLWNKDTDLIDNGTIQLGSKVDVKNATAKERNGIVELSLGYSGTIKAEKGKDKSVVKLSRLEEGMSDVSCYARVERIYPVKEFQKEKGTGKIASLVITDGATARLALWDDNADWAEKLSEGDMIKAEGAYVKENRGQLELNLGWRGRLVLDPQDAPKIKGMERAEVAGLEDGQRAEIAGTVVKIYPPNTFQQCSNCNKSAPSGECCGEVTPAMVVNAEIDDGTGTIRCAFFREQAEKLLGTTAERFIEDGKFDDGGMGKEMVVVGSVKENKMFQRNEMVVRSFREADVEQEIMAAKGE